MSMDVQRYSTIFAERDRSVRAGKPATVSDPPHLHPPYTIWNYGNFAPSFDSVCLVPTAVAHWGLRAPLVLVRRHCPHAKGASGNRVLTTKGHPSS